MSHARGGRGSLASLTSPDDDPFHRNMKLRIWDRFYEDGDKDILGHSGLVIAKDGGVSDVHDLDYSMMYVKALLICLFLIVNVLMIIRADLSALYEGNLTPKEREATKGFLLSKHLFDSIGVSTWLSSCFDQLIPLLELLALCAVGGRLLWRGVQACYQGCMQFREPENHNRALKKWTNVSLMFWESVPEVSSFSAMKLLYYVTPSVMATQAYNHVEFAIANVKKHKSRKSRVLVLLPLLSYIAMCICCLVIGFDTFLIKFRIAQSFVMSHQFNWGSVFQAVVFLYQVLGVVNLNWFVRERLGIFIFGGEDGSVDADERARWEVWNAMLAREIYREYHGLIGTAMMLGFDDYDFQSLVLDDSGKEHKLRTRAAALGAGKSLLLRMGTSKVSVDERPGTRTPPETSSDGDDAGANDRDPEAACRGEADPEDDVWLVAGGGFRGPAGGALQPLQEPLLGGSSGGAAGRDARPGEKPGPATLPGPEEDRADASDRDLEAACRGEASLQEPLLGGASWGAARRPREPPAGAVATRSLGAPPGAAAIAGGGGRWASPRPPDPGALGGQPPPPPPTGTFAPSDPPAGDGGRSASLRPWALGGQQQPPPPPPTATFAPPDPPAPPAGAPGAGAPAAERGRRSPPSPEEAAAASADGGGRSAEERRPRPAAPRRPWANRGTAASSGRSGSGPSSGASAASGAWSPSRAALVARREDLAAVVAALAARREDRGAGAIRTPPGTSMRPSEASAA